MRDGGNPSPILRVFQTRDQTRAFYDKISRVYDLLAERSEAPMRKRGLDRFAATSGEIVLEIGCGTGRCLADLAEAVGPDGRVHGLDLSSGMLEQSRKHLESRDLLDRAELREGDATTLPYEDRSMDGVFMSFTLELFDTPEIPKVLGESLRVLRDGGRVVVVGMSKADSDPLLRVYEWTHEHFPNFVDCRPIFVRRAVEDAGFHVAASETRHMWVPVEIVRGERREDERES